MMEFIKCQAHKGEINGADIALWRWCLSYMSFSFLTGSRRGSSKNMAGKLLEAESWPCFMTCVCVCVCVVVSLALAHNFRLTTMSRFSVYTCATCNKGFTGFMKQGLKCLGKCRLADMLKDTPLPPPPPPHHHHHKYKFCMRPCTGFVLWHVWVDGIGGSVGLCVPGIKKKMSGTLSRTVIKLYSFLKP